jgi:putative spermidine/putrescine transport system substrate-binding protein
MHGFRLLGVILICYLAMACSSSTDRSKANPDLATLPWEDIVIQAKGQTLNLSMWQGSPIVNRYIQEFLKPRLAQQYDIDLQVNGGYAAGLVGTLMHEIEADQAESLVDIMWINGATFFQLQQIGALYGPFLDQLPHATYIDLDDPFISLDFQQPINGMECPWGNLQFSMVYDSAQVSNPPRSLTEFEGYVQSHPGTFTISNDFTGMTLLKCWLIELSGAPDGLDGPFDEATYQRLSTELWARINGMKPYFWKEGQTFPHEGSQLNQMFASGELSLIYGNNDALAENQVLAGLFPPSTRSYVLRAGTIRNTHYLGIAQRSPHHAAALVALNEMISPAAQATKMDPNVWGDYTILSLERLPAEWQQQFAQLPERQYALRRADIEGRSLMEPAPAYMTRLIEDFRTQVINRAL